MAEKADSGDNEVWVKFICSFIFFYEVLLRCYLKFPFNGNVVVIQQVIIVLSVKNNSNVY